VSIQPYTAAPPALAPNAGYSLIRETAAAMADAHAIAKAISNTDMVPKHFRGKPDDLTAAILYGATLGFDPMQSARQVFVIHGQAALYARSMAALVMAAGHEVWTVETTDTAVTVEGKRRGAARNERSTWTIERAKKAGYTDNAKYRTDPQAMLYAKALSEVCRKIAPDVLNGVYAVEEMQMERVESERVDQPTNQVDRMRAALNPSPAPGVGAPEPAVDDAAPGPGTPLPDVQQRAGEALLLDPTSSLAKALYARLRESGIDKAGATALYAEVTGREVESSKELTEDEARAVLRELDVTDAELVEDQS
jgi:hypothetical protein